MLRDFQQVVHAVEPGFTSQVVGYVAHPNLCNRVDHDMPAVHGVTAAYFHMRVHPDANGATDPPAANPFAKLPCEHHDDTRLNERPVCVEAS